MMEGFNNSNQDFLTEYRAISGKLKKRFLRKPNVSEASQQFAKLAKKVKTNEEPQYEGMCHLAIARCEQSIANTQGEAEALISASRCYLLAEESINDLGSPSFEENLTSSIQTYNHAIRLLSEKGDHFRASGLCIELGDALVNLNKPGEAITFYGRAAEFRPKSSLSFLFAQEKVGKTHVVMGDYHSALNVFTEIATTAEQTCKKPATSVYHDILAKCEIYRVLLLLLIQPTPQTVSPSLTSVLEKYAWETSCPPIISNSDQSSQGGGSGGAFGAGNPSPGGIVGNQYLSEDVFLLLQSVVMAVQVRDGNALTELEDYLVPHLHSEPLHRDLLRQLLVSMNAKCDSS